MITSTYFFQNCRDGFNHVAILMLDGKVINKKSTHYINRTWESYNGQTARRRACECEIKRLESWAVSLAKQETGRRRVCAEVNELAQKFLAGTYYQDLKNHYDSL